MESLFLPIINYISQSFPEIPYVDEDYGQLKAILFCHVRSFIGASRPLAPRCFLV